MYKLKIRVIDQKKQFLPLSRHVSREKIVPLPSDLQNLPNSYMPNVYLLCRLIYDATIERVNIRLENLEGVTIALLSIIDDRGSSAPGRVYNPNTNT